MTTDRDSLLKELDLGGTDAPGSTSLLTDSSATPTAPPPSPFALDLDPWAVRRGKDLLKETPAPRQEKLGGEDLASQSLADFHAAAFEPDPKLAETCTDTQRHDFLRTLLETPDYQALHAATQLNEAASEIAAQAFAENFGALRAATPPPPPPGDGECKGGKGKGKPSPAPDPDKAAFAREMAVMGAVGKALEEASKEVDAAADAAAAMGMGPGSPGSNDPRAIAALYRRIRNDPTLKRVCELAGRYRRVAQSKQRQKVTHGMDDMVGVEMDGDLGRLLPHELAKLALPEFELDTLRRIVERQAMCRLYRAVEPVAKGPVIYSVDESGSMQGDKGDTAKAIALSMAYIARQQKRWCALVAYSGDTGQRLLALPPGKWNENALMDWLCPFIGGGSNLDVPVREMPQMYEDLGAPRGKTDVVLITDAICHIPQGIQESFTAWKAHAQARVISLIIRSTPGDLAHVSDEVHMVESLDCSEEGVERVLSVWM